MKNTTLAFFLLLFTASHLFSQEQIISDEQLKRNLERHVYTLAADSMMGRKARTQEIIPTIKYIKNEFKKIGLKPYKEDTYDQIFSQGVNLIGLIEGSDSILKNECILVVAHHDHIGFKTVNGSNVVYNGADDNASGVAALLEIARNISNNDKKPSRTIVFITLDAEELGLIGSNYFVNNCPLPLENIKFVFNLDMVGALKLGGELTYAGVKMLKGGKKIFDEHSNDIDGLKVNVKDFDKMFLGDSDHSSFAVKDIPAVYISTGLKSPYHKPEDDAELIDYDGLVLVTKHVTKMVNILDSEEILEKSGKKSFKHRRGSRYSIGITAGAGNSRLNYTSGPITGKPYFAYNGGMYMQYESEFFTIRPGLIFEQKSYPQFGPKITNNALTVPLNLFISSSKKMGVYFSIGIGAYYSYNISGKIGNAELDYINEYNRNDGGLMLTYSLTIIKFELGYTALFGQNELLKNKPINGSNFKSSSQYFYIGYKF